MRVETANPKSAVAQTLVVTLLARMDSTELLELVRRTTSDAPGDEPVPVAR